MKHKKGVIFICLIICLFSIASVCASDVNETVVANENQNQEVINIENSNEFKNAENNVLSVSTEDNLGVVDGTFAQLNNKIQNAGPGSKIVLTQNYTYQDISSDTQYINGITIDKPLTIEGNGMFIDGSNKAKIFNIRSDNVIIKNINFIHAQQAIYWFGSNGLINNSNFINNTFSYFSTNSKYNETAGALLYLSGTNITIDNSNFINNKIIKTASSLTVDNPSDRGMMIRTTGARFYFYNSNFINNQIDLRIANSNLVRYLCNGGLITIDGRYNELINDTFKNNIVNFKVESSSNSETEFTIGINGGILMTGGECKLVNTIFSNNKVHSNSSCTGKQTLITNSRGIVNLRDSLIILNSTFESNSLQTYAICYNSGGSAHTYNYGGMLYMAGLTTVLSITNSSFLENYAHVDDQFGSVIYSENVPLNIQSSIFDGDSQVESIYCKANINISGSIFSNFLKALNIEDAIGKINYNIFIMDNNTNDYIFGNNNSNIDYNWWGSNNNPQPYVNGVVCNNWLCLNVDIDDSNVSSQIISSKLNSLSDGSFLNDEDYVKLPIRNVTYTLLGNGSLSSYNSDTVSEINYLNEIPGEYTIKITSKVDNQITEITKTFDIINIKEGSFTDLQNLILNFNGNILDLTRNYTYDSSDDFHMKKFFNLTAKEGIVINKTLTINGNGFTINGNNSSKIFNILADEVCINNIGLLNSSNSLYWNAKEGILSNSVFNNILINSNANVSLYNNSEIGSNDFVILLNGGIYLQNNSFQSIIDVGEDGIIYSNTSTIILNGQNIYMDLGNVNLYAYVFDDNNNKIKVPQLEFTTSDVNYNGNFDGNKYVNNELILDKSKSYLISAIVSSNLLNNNIIPARIISNIIGINLTINSTTIRVKENVTAVITFDFDEINGTVSLLIDNAVYKTIVVSDEINISISGLIAGNHSITAIYNGDNNFKPVNSSTNIYVDKLDLQVNVDEYTINYGETVDIVINVLNNDATGNISVIVNDITYNEHIANGRVIFNLPILSAKEYGLEFNYIGDVNYAEKTFNTKLIVNKLDSSVFSSVDETCYGDVVTVNVKANLEGKVIVKIGDTYSKTTNVQANKITPVTFDMVAAGKYNVLITFNPSDENYNHSTYSTELEVLKKDTTVRVSVVNINYGEPVIVNVTASEDGEITIKLGNITKQTSAFGNLVKSINFGMLPVGSYDVLVTFTAGDNYQNSSDEDSFTITPAKAFITEIQKENSIYGENVIIKVKTSVDGKITIYIGDISKESNVKVNKSTSIDFGILDAKTYDVEIILDAGNNYTSPKNTTTISVIPKETTLTLNVLDSIYGENVVVNVTASENGNLSVKIGSIIKNATVEANKLTSIDFGILDIGSYDVIANFTAGNNYKVSFDTKNIEITSNLEPIDIDITIPEINSIEDKEFTINLPNDVSGTITLTINNENHTFNVTNGVANIIIPDLDNADYPYTITYSGDEKYAPFTKNGILTINIIIETVIANDMTVEYGGEYDFNATFLNSDGTPLINKYVTFLVDGKAYSNITDSKGIAYLKIGLTNGTYTIISINPKTDENKTNILIVNAPIPQSIDDNNITIPSLNGGVGTIRLPSDASGYITIDIAGKRFTFPVVNGIANVNVPNLANGVYGYIIIYSGDIKYSSFSKTGTLNVNKVTPKPTPVKTVIKLTLKKVKVKKSAKKLVIKATLKINGKVAKGKVIKFKFNKKSYKAKTNAKGVAKITIKKAVLKKLKKGKKVTYAATYGKVTKKVTVKVLK